MFWGQRLHQGIRHFRSVPRGASAAHRAAEPRNGAQLHRRKGHGPAALVLMPTPSPKAVPKSPSGALTGIRVVDLSRVLGGPYCTQILSDHGARVVKVEPPMGDETRTWGPPFVEGTASYFLGVNRNKQDIVLDLSRPEGREAVLRLLAAADTGDTRSRVASCHQRPARFISGGLAPCTLYIINHCRCWRAAVCDGARSVGGARAHLPARAARTGADNRCSLRACFATP